MAAVLTRFLRKISGFGCAEPGRSQDNAGIVGKFTKLDKQITTAGSGRQPSPFLCWSKEVTKETTSAALGLPQPAWGVRPMPNCSSRLKSRPCTSPSPRAMVNLRRRTSSTQRRLEASALPNLHLLQLFLSAQGL